LAEAHDLIQGAADFLPLLLTADAVMPADDIGKAVATTDPVQGTKCVANVAFAAGVRAYDDGERPNGQFLVHEVLEINQPEVGDHWCGQCLTRIGTVADVPAQRKCAGRPTRLGLPLPTARLAGG